MPGLLLISSRISRSARRLAKAARCVTVGSMVGVIALGSMARSADADDSRGATRAVAARERGRPYTMVEVSVGTLALPAAKVCPTGLNQCSRGEVSLALGIRNIYEFGRFGVGAGVVWATTLRNDTARGAAELERDHARRYFLIEGMFRYMFAQGPRWEFWAAANVGGVGVSDSWTVKADRKPLAGVSFLGPKASTIGTEGLAVGAGFGGAFIVIQNLSVGGHLRYENWILPSSPKINPTGDVASLSGRLDIFDLGFDIAYRLSL